ncbi:MAG TPA: lamin tail domain-containing protein, partial [Chthoniobacteraceae bacterium]|nr:lamin tail domain-containing protein [Chthoniobacteraceae bacterium]
MTSLLRLLRTPCCSLVSIGICLFTALQSAWAAPTVTVTSPIPGATVSTLTSVAITFNEAVTGVDANDLSVGGTVATFVTGSGAGPYTFTFTQPQAGSVLVDWVGDHGIAGQAGTGAFAPDTFWTYTLTDSIAPTVADRTPTANSTVSAMTQVVVAFTEPVTGVGATDLLINGAPAAGVTGDGLGPYTFTFAQPAVGTVTFSWAAGHGIQDTASPANDFAGGNWTATLSVSGIGNLVINEFLSSNGIGILDENADQEDWIELYNPGPVAVNLTGWALTTEIDKPAEWVFPPWTLNAGQYMIVYASGKNRKPAQTTAGVDNANTVASPRLHTNFTINENGGYLALVSPNSPRTLVSEFNLYPEQRTDFSYGPQPSGGLRYFTPPTPKAANSSSTLTAVTPRVGFSVNRGFFKDPFQLVLTCTDPAATIKYTTNHTEPTAANGTVYTSPIPISATTVVRAVAFNAGKIPSFPVTHSYIYLDQVLTQPMNPAGFPSNWGAHASFPGGVVPADYGMDTDPVRVDPNNAGSAIDPVKQQRLKDALRELPIVSITLPIIDMFGTNGLYYNPNVTNKSFGYKKCSVEMILPDGSSAFAVVCGIGGHGNASRDPLKNPKHGFQLKFKGEYGGSSLDYQLFPESPVAEYDDIILRPDFNSSWRHWSDDTSNGNGLLQRTRGTRVRDAWSKNTFRDMGGLASNHRFFHMFINGLYWGTYDFAEQPVEGFAQELMGGDKADYAIVQEAGFLNGADSVYTTMAAMPNITTNALYDQMKGYLDVPEFIDYMLLHFYIGHQDWGAAKNWYAIRRRASASNPTQGKYQYVPWDQECTLLEPNVNRVTTTDLPTVNSSNASLHTRLTSHAQYKLDFADRVHRQMIAPGGPLTPASNIARWQKWQGIMDKPIVAESARWGDYRRDVHQYQTGSYVLYTREGHFLPECTRLTGTYFPNRGNTIIGQLQSVGLYPNVAAPLLREGNPAGPIVGTKQVSPGYVLAMTNPSASGTIYFTTDGNDPHIIYTPTTVATAASIAPTAITYTAPIIINSTTTIKARVLTASGTWTALNEATFTTGIALPAIRITEIMYNPPGGNAHEFLEVQNTGTSEVDLSAWYFEGVGFYFPVGTVLNAGGRLLLANNDGKSGAFAGQYPGVTPFGWFSGSLDNTGERIALLDAIGRVIASVTYDDTVPWSLSADGGGVSLEIVDPDGDPNDPANWKSSNALKGTPGTPNSPPAAQSVVINEVRTFGDSFIEMYNTSASPVSIGGWELRGSLVAAISPGTTIAGNSYFVYHSPLPSNEGSIAIYTNSSLSARVDAVSWGNQVVGFTIGRVAGNWTLCNPSPNAANTAAPLAPPSSLAINEWLAKPSPGEGDWLELYNKHATLPVALRGVHVQTSKQIFPIRSLSFIGSQRWLQLFADELPGGNHLGLKLDGDGSTIALVDINNTTFDTVAYTAQTEAVTSGRLPDGSGPITSFPGSASPGAANYLASSYTGPVLHEVLARNLAAGAAPWGTHADWCELQNLNAGAVNIGGMRLGLTNDFENAWIIPSGTSVPGNGFLSIWCDGARPADSSTNADLNTGFSLGDFSGGLYLFNSSGQLVSFVEWGPQVIDCSVGRDAGTWKLLSSPTRAVANAGPATLGAVASIRINEWASALAGGDWFELYNLNVNPVALTGLYLTDDPG